MAHITFKGSPIATAGEIPTVGQSAPALNLTKNDLSELTNADFSGKRVILNIFPSIDTGVCARSVRRFNEAASEVTDALIVNVSADLPFAQSRFCGAEGISCAIAASSFRSTFGHDYGLTMTEGPLRGLLARAVLVLDEQGRVIHSELVPEIAQEPNYDAALSALNA